MSKLYIIFGFLNDINGGLIYTANKAEYMESLGWDVQVIDSTADNIILESLKKYKNNAVSFRLRAPYMFTKKQREECLDELIKITGWNNSYEETIIESLYGMCSLWAELLAKKIGAKHMLFNCTADVSLNPYLSSFYDYFWFKHQRKEFVSISKEVYKRIFRDYKQLTDDECLSARFYCTNSLRDVEPPFLIDKSKFDYVLGTVGRTNKGSFAPTISEYAKLIKKYSNKKFAVLIVGSEAESDTNKALAPIADLPNVEIFRTGVIFPIPEKLIKQMDVCVASHGSVKMPTKCGVKTISVKDENADMYGIMGYTITKFPGYNYYLDGTISEVVEDILINKAYDNTEYIDLYESENTNLDYWFKPHLKLIENSEKSKEYYATEKIKLSNSLKFTTRTFINKCFGSGVLTKAQVLYSKIIKLRR